MPFVTRFFQRISRHAPLSGDRLPSEDEIPSPLNATTLRLTDRARRADTRYPTTG